MDKFDAALHLRKREPYIDLAIPAINEGELPEGVLADEKDIPDDIKLKQGDLLFPEAKYIPAIVLVGWLLFALLYLLFLTLLVFFLWKKFFS